MNFISSRIDSLITYNRLSRTAAIVFFVFILIISSEIIAPLQTLAQGNKKAVIPKVGDKAPDFSLQYFNGKPFTLSKIGKGKPVLLWFTNLCSGCQSKLPYIEKLNKKYHNKEIEVFAVSQLGNDRKTVEDVIHKNNLTVRFLYDPTGEATTRYAGRYTPGTCPLTNIYLINRAGNISFATHFPGVPDEELTEQINNLMKVNHR
jgi:peroxiredoxin